MSRKCDFIIIGQGIAGICLAWQLKRLGRSFVVLDRADRFSASRVAAGMVNPMTFRRALKAWNVDTMLPIARDFYNSIPGCEPGTFTRDTQIYKVFATPEEPELWKTQIENGKGVVLKPDSGKMMIKSGIL